MTEKPVCVRAQQQNKTKDNVARQREQLALNNSRSRRVALRAARDHRRTTPRRAVVAECGVPLAWRLWLTGRGFA